MAKYVMNFWFEWCGPCLWAADDKTRDIFDCSGIWPEDLPLSQELQKELESLSEEHHTSLNWASPLDPSPWSKEHFDDFWRRARIAHKRLQEELGEDYEIVYRVHETYD